MVRREARTKVGVRQKVRRVMTDVDVEVEAAKVKHGWWVGLMIRLHRFSNPARHMAKF